jgi:hypothetical protein
MGSTKTAAVIRTVLPMMLEMIASVTWTGAGGSFLLRFELPRGVTVYSAP